MSSFTINTNTSALFFFRLVPFQVLPQQITVFHLNLFSVSSTRTPATCMSSLTVSINLLFGLPLCLLTGSSISSILLPLSLPCSCPNHLKWALCKAREMWVPLNVGFLFGVYHSTGPDLFKIKALVEWPTPTTCKQLQCFLGFANYRHFITDFSWIAAPLTSLTATLRAFRWTVKAQEALDRLKERFVLALVLTHSDPARQFVVEVDALDTEVGAVLSQQVAEDIKLPSSAKQNYDSGKKTLNNTVIMTVVDRFSKSAHFIPFPKLPSALDTGELLVQHVFCLHWIPRDIVSDRWSQLTSQVFCHFYFSSFHHDSYFSL